MHVVVVGSGIAGLTAALRASRRHRVTLVTKGDLVDGCTRYAQGGIAAALFPDDSVAAHVADTLRAGAGLCDPDAVSVLCADGPERVRELVDLGVPFDREGGELARGHEAAHSARRILHADGDATGLAVQTALAAAVRRARVRVLENAFLDEILVDGCRAVGVGLLTEHGPEVAFADVVILATGGAGQLYRHTTNPVVATGDGVAAAWRAGAHLRDLEFYQFHPTALAAPGSPLLSEAVRGEGAVLRDTRGHRFMLERHPDAELAPRDVVARAIASVIAEQDGAPVLLDARGLGADRLASRFPGLTTMLHRHGIDWATELVPVTPAAHYWMGGVATDVRGRTSIPGLYAVGEVAGTGAHGANRLASNSLLEALVFAARAVDDLDASRGGEGPAGASAPPARPVGNGNASGSVIGRREIQSIMWDSVGMYRSRDGLEHGREALEGRRVVGETREDRETANLLDLARLVTAAALGRIESCGAHVRIDSTLEAPALAARTGVSAC
jgi:L-aspartate oxidase